MKIKRVIAFVLCLSVLSVTSCSKGDGSSKTSTGTTTTGSTDSADDGTKAESRTEPASAAVPAEVPAGRKGYQTAYYSFDADEDLTVSEKIERDGGVKEYSFKGGKFIELTIQGAYVDQLTPIASVKYNAEDFEERDTVKDFEWKVIEDAPYECAAYFFTDTRDKEVRVCGRNPNHRQERPVGDKSDEHGNDVADSREERDKEKEALIVGRTDDAPPNGSKSAGNSSEWTGANTAVAAGGSIILAALGAVLFTRYITPWLWVIGKRRKKREEMQRRVIA